MLYQFLEEHREKVLELTEHKTLKLAGALPSSVRMKSGLPIFFEHLISYLKSPVGSPENELNAGAAIHGKELLRLNYTLSHVVHAYGAMCQAITELAGLQGIKISSQDFNHLNLCHLILEVEDECGGLSPSVEKNLFKPFASSGFDQTGLGLGLTIVQRAVTLLQGNITARNIPGQGCAFKLEIPIKRCQVLFTDAEQ